MYIRMMKGLNLDLTMEICMLIQTTITFLPIRVHWENQLQLSLFLSFYLTQIYWQVQWATSKN